MPANPDEWGESAYSGAEDPAHGKADGPPDKPDADADANDDSAVLLPPPEDDSGHTVMLSKPVYPGTSKLPPLHPEPDNDGWDGPAASDSTGLVPEDDNDSPEWAQTLVLDSPSSMNSAGTGRRGPGDIDSAIRIGTRTTFVDPPDGGPPARIPDLFGFNEPSDVPEDSLKTLVDPPEDALKTLVDPPDSSNPPEDALKTLVDPPPTAPLDSLKTLVDSDLGDFDGNLDDDNQMTLVDPPDADTLRKMVSNVDAEAAKATAKPSNGDDFFNNFTVTADTRKQPGAAASASKSADEFFDSFSVSATKKNDDNKSSKSGDDFFNNFSVSAEKKTASGSAADDDFFSGGFTVKADLEKSHRGYGYDDDDDDEPEPLPDDLDKAALALIIEGGSSNGDDDSAWLDFMPAGELSRATNPLSTSALLELGGGGSDTADQAELEALRSVMGSSPARQWDAPAQEMIETTTWEVSNPGAGIDSEITRAIGHGAPPPPPPIRSTPPAPPPAPLQPAAPLPTWGYETTTGINIYDDAPAFIMEAITPHTRVLALATVMPRLDRRPVDRTHGLRLTDEGPAWIAEPALDENGEVPDYDAFNEDTTVTGELPPGWRSIIQNLRAAGHETIIAPEPPQVPASTGRHQTGARQADTTWHENAALRRITEALGADGHDAGDNDLTVTDSDLDGDTLTDRDTLTDDSGVSPFSDQAPPVGTPGTPGTESDSASASGSGSDTGEVAEGDIATATDQPLLMAPIEEISWESESPSDVAATGRNRTRVLQPGDGTPLIDLPASGPAGQADDLFPHLQAADFLAPTTTQVMREVQAVTSGVTDRYAQLEREVDVLREKYQQLLDSYERIRGAVRLAKAYQQQMLPEPPRDQAGIEIGVLYKPAEHVSGDFYDFITLTPERYAVTIGDISGHGIAPALIMTVCRKVLHLFLDQGLDAATALHRTNQVICRDLPAATFITAIASVIDLGARTFTFARAGHPAPLIFNPRERGADPIEPNPRGMAIGMDPGPIFNRTVANETVELKPNDLIVLYSDGVIEISDKRGEQFGRNRFIELITEFGYGTVPFLMRKIGNTLQSYRAGSNQDDDVSVVVIKVLSEQSPETVLKRKSEQRGDSSNRLSTSGE
ncbi:MAG: PP2C family protein-serine/threonine phosphatase [Planctomycetota bacterium]